MFFKQVRFCPRSRAFTFRGANPFYPAYLNHTIPPSQEETIIFRRFSHVPYGTRPQMRPVSGCRALQAATRCTQFPLLASLAETPFQRAAFWQHFLHHQGTAKPHLHNEDFIIYRQKTHLSSNFLKKIDFFTNFETIKPFFRQKRQKKRE